MDKKYFSAPTTVNLELTELCNVKCRHCYNPWRDETMGEISLSEIKQLMSIDGNDEFDELFFLILNKNSEIVIQSSKTIKTISDCYLFSARVKFFINLISSSKDIVEAEKNFPRYLFKLRSRFLLIYKKIDKRKISKINFLINKFEIMLRKQSGLHFLVCQRFILNLKQLLR